MHRRTVLGSALALSLVGTLSPQWATQQAMADVGPVPDVTTAHPRLFVTDFEAVRTTIAADATVAKWFAKVKADADGHLGKELPPAPPAGTQMLWTARDYHFRVFSLALVYRLTSQKKYLDECKRVVAHFIAYPDWNAMGHTLDAAEFAQTTAVAYDWLHDEWTTAEAQAIRSALVTKALDPALAWYADHEYWTWPGNSTNWNIVCNSSFAIAALALAQDEPTKARAVLTEMPKSILNGLKEYGPDGGYPEGIGGYWEYATLQLVMLIDCLRTATGEEIGLADAPGVSTTGWYPLHTHSNSLEAWDYGDGYPNRKTDPVIFWLADRFGDQAVWRWWGLQVPETSVNHFHVLWGRSGPSKDPLAAGVDLQAKWRHLELSTARSTWLNPRGTFAGVKGGSNQAGHANLDLGTFVLDSLGQRFADEGGYGNSGLAGYWDSIPGGQRWSLYRQRAEGQNTMVFAPGLAADQREVGTGTIVAHAANPRDTFTVLDLDDATTAVTGWRRGLRLTDSRRQVVVQDEVTTAAPIDQWWFMHTVGTITVSDDGRSARVSVSGSELLARVVEPAGATFTSAPAEPLWTSPIRDQDDNSAWRKLTLRLPAQGSTRVVVQFSPVVPGAPDLPLLPVSPLAQWQLTNDEPLKHLLVGGKQIAGFRADVRTYDLDLAPGQALPRMVATAGGPGRPVRRDRLTGASGNERGVVEFTMPGGTVHSVRIWRQPGPSDLTAVVQASGFQVTAPPENTLDGKLDTRWAAEGAGQWIAYDLGSNHTLSSVEMAWASGDTRTAWFDLDVAADGATTWTRLLTKQATAKSAGLEPYTFASQPVRRVRITGYGNTQNAWNSINEVRFPGVSLAVPPRAASLVSVAITADAVTIGATTTFTLKATWSDAATRSLEGATVEWISLDDTVAAVDDRGVATGVGAGVTRIAAVVTTASHELRWAVTTVQVTDGKSVVLRAVADTYVQQSTPTTNFGTATELVVKRATSASRETLLRFAPGAAVTGVTKVELVVKARVYGTNGSLDVGWTQRTWEERVVTWNDRPYPGESVDTVAVTATSPTEHILDVTALVSPRLAAGQVVELSLFQADRGTAFDGVAVASRESATPPELRITLG